MPSVLQINVCANWGSTGRIAEQINDAARKQGWNTYFAYGRSINPLDSKTIHVGCKVSTYEHYAEHRLFDNDGLASRMATKRFVREIERIKPDVIHLHNIHDHFLNYRILFEYINSVDIPVVWTQHDCWAFTGGCGHFSLLKCNKWRDGGCDNSCPIKTNKTFLFGEKTLKHYQLKKALFSANKNLTLVPVSSWMSNLLHQSFLKEKRVETICNGVDTTLFNPNYDSKVRDKYALGEERYLIAVSGVWLPYKGWNDYLELAKLLPKGVRLVLVGLDNKKIQEAEAAGIIGIPKVDNRMELAALYANAEIVLNLSKEESFGLTTVEGLACGTPGIVYDSTASPELVNEDTGIVVKEGDVSHVIGAINLILNRGKSYYAEACRKRAVDEFCLENQLGKYINLYNKILMGA